jgi:site-specific recombinase XerD
MSHIPNPLVAQLREVLTCQRFSSVVVHNYCRNAAHFLEYLAQREVAVENVMSARVSNYLRYAIRQFCRRRGRPPADRWHAIPRAGIHALLRMVRGKWPPEAPPANAGEAACRTACRKYDEYLRDERGLAKASIDALMWEGRHFLSWYVERTGAPRFRNLSIKDIDAYFAMRASHLRRRSLKDVAERLRSLAHFLYRSGHIGIDLAPRIIGPIMYAYESIPSALTQDQIASVLKNTRKDRSPLGLRDYAILLLLSTYGMRAGEIKRLRIEDIDWRAGALHIRHSKTGVQSQLPLVPVVGNALLDYLRRGRPKTEAREVFIRARAPYSSMVCIYSEIRRRLEAAGVEPIGKWGPHAFRHARAVSMLRASVSRKVIGDLLGHRSEEATLPYLKLATEDLRAIGLEIPEARP